LFGLYNLKINNTHNIKYIKIGLLQGNISQDIKNKQYIYYSDILYKYLYLQKLAMKEGVEIILWPEISFPLALSKNIKYLELSSGDASFLVIGAASFRYYKNNNDKSIIFYNSAFIINSKENIVIDRFDKTHLVPFGEYIPWPFNIFIKKIIYNTNIWNSGCFLNPIILSLSNKKQIIIGVTICYEGIFPEISWEFANRGAELIINLSNDGWYGISSAPYQHLNAYKMRAVETGRSFARVTNNGISAFINFNGVITFFSDISKETLLIGDISMISNRTIYLILGDIIPVIIIIFLLIIIIFSFIKFIYKDNLLFK
jgi:apolipoprotein N-acyltransferase